MVEYGNGISHGPAGQTGGSSHPLVTGGDPFANIGHAVDQGVAFVGSLSPIELVALIAVVFIGLMILRRAF
jgi:hypothetical protein